MRVANCSKVVPSELRVWWGYCHDQKTLELEEITQLHRAKGSKVSAVRSEYLLSLIDGIVCMEYS
jgi:hypothetical protein